MVKYVFAMKSNLHPKYEQVTVTCACGHNFQVGGTVAQLHVDVCSNCHPFFTGTQKFVDTLGRVDKFIAKRKAASGYVKKGKKATDEVAPKSLKEMLEVKKAQEAKETKAVSQTA